MYLCNIFIHQFAPILLIHGVDIRVLLQNLYGLYGLSHEKLATFVEKPCKSENTIYVVKLVGHSAKDENRGSRSLPLLLLIHGVDNGVFNLKK